MISKTTRPLKTVRSSGGRVPKRAPALPFRPTSEIKVTNGDATRHIPRLLGFHLRPLTLSLAALVVGAGLGCGRSEKHVGSVGTGGDGSAEAGAPGTGGSDTAGSGGVGGGRAAGGSAGVAGASAGRGEGGVPPDACPSPSPPPATLQRLDNFEYDNTVGAVFPNVARPGVVLPAEVTNADDTSFPTSVGIAAYHRLAHDYAVSVTEDADALSELLGCDPADADACRGAFLEGFLARAFRRPASGGELDEFEQVFFNGEELGEGFTSGVRAVIEVALQSPEFLYRIEYGEPAEERGAGWARPTPYETASRLSYTYLGAPPDAPLLEAAARDELRSEEQLAAQAARLLSDPRARRLVPYFFERLNLLASTFPSVDPASFPRFTSSIAALLPQQATRFLNDVVFDGPGDLTTLLTAPYSFMNEELASYYELGSVSGSDFQRVALDPSRGGGLLVQGSFLVRHPRVVPRGLRILTSLLCEPPSPPPADVVVTVPPPSTEAQTMRERLQQHSTDPSCAGCHQMIDPFGFAFGHFDEAGVYMELENGLPIDTSADVMVGDVAGHTADLPELLNKLAESPQVKRCLASKWMTFGLNRELSDADACSRQQVETAFIESGGSLQELFVALASTDAFRYRPATEVTP
jgi:hypothetical protein